MSTVLESAIRAGMRRGLSGARRGPVSVPRELLQARGDRARALAEQVSAETGVDVEEIFGRRRFRGVVGARHRVMRGLWESGLSIADVAVVLGMHHTTVMYGLRKEFGPAYQREVLSRYTPQRRGSYRGRVSSEERDEHRRDEGDDAIAEERDEREAERRERGW